MSGRVEGKKVLITGAARGMGRSHAVRLAQEGADVILIDICESLPAVEYPLATTDELAETARLVEAQGRRAVTHVVDVRDLEALTAAVDDGVAQLGGIDASVANAGVLTFTASSADDGKQYRAVFTNDAGIVTTGAATLKVQGAAPSLYLPTLLK